LARSKTEWQGRTDDSMPSQAVRIRIFRMQDGRCPACSRNLQPGNITCDHIKPLEDGGENREANLQLICTDPCSLRKTGDENRRRAKADRVAAKRLGFKQSRHPVLGSRQSPWKRKLDGTVVRRDEDE